MTTTNYLSIREIRQQVVDLDRWADTRETALPVAAAIHAIASTGRPAQAIWEDPTPAEWDHVSMAVEAYIAAGECEADEDGSYCWGEATIKVQA